MAAMDDVRDLAMSSQRTLNASHDYYMHVKETWKFVKSRVLLGDRLTIDNSLTGSSVDQDRLLELIPEYILKYLNNSTFTQFLSIFEDFLFDLIGIWLRAYPASLSEKMLKFSTVLTSTDRTEVITVVIERELNELKYQKVADWFDYFNKLARPGCPSPDEIEQIAERKAGRDILAHNKGIVNAIYLSKAGKCARYRVGEILEIPDDCHRETWQLVKKIIDDLATAVIPKLPAP